MYYFVELLRAKGALRLALILLGIILLTAIILRIAVHGPTVDGLASKIEHSPTAHVTTQTLPGGSVREIVDDPQRQTHAVITRGAESIHLDIREPMSRRNEQRGNVSMGSITENEDDRGGIAHVTIDYKSGHTFDWGILFLASIPMGLIIATVLAGPLAKENDGHLELAWTKPVSRGQYAAAAIGVDMVTIVISQLLTIAVILLGALLFIVPRFSLGSPILWLFALLAPIAWYSLLTMCSASIKRGPGMVIGLGWVFGFLVPALAQGLAGAAPYNSVAAGFYAVFHTISYLDPLAYLSFDNQHSGTVHAFGISAPVAAAIFAVLTIGYTALSVLQWRRVEA